MVGGGQLARMTAAAAVGLGATFRVLAGSESESAARVTHDVAVGSHLSLADLSKFAGECDVITFDHEHVPTEHLVALQAAGSLVRPGPGALQYTQDKLAMRRRLAGLGAPMPRFAPVSSVADVAEFGSWPVVLKAVSGGYDGKGVWIVDSADRAAEVVAAAAAHGTALMAEEFVPFRRELAAQVARSACGQGAAYPVVETVQVDGICREVIAPAPGIREDLAVEAQELALRIASALDVVGMLAVELFETPRGILVNELAMRPHNSGHWSIEGACTSQFEQHLRAVLDLPLGSPAPVVPGGYTVMANVLGGTDPDVYDRYIHVMAADPAVKVHFYGKEVRPGRKIGHVTLVGTPADSVESLRDRARRAASYLRWGTEDGD